MIARIRLYMTFESDWIQTVDQPGETLHEILGEGFENNGEVLSAFEYHDGVVILNLASSKDCELLEDMIWEILLSNLDGLCETDFDIEIDLDVSIGALNYDY